MFLSPCNIHIAIPAPSLEMEVGLLALPWSSEIPVSLSSFPHIFLNGLSWLKFSVYGIKDKWSVCDVLVFPVVQGTVCSLKLCKQILSMLYKNYSNTICQGKHHSIAKQILVFEARKFQTSESSHTPINMIQLLQTFWKCRSWQLLHCEPTDFTESSLCTSSQLFLIRKDNL